MTRTVRRAWQQTPLVVAFLVAAVAVCALVVVAAISAGGPAELSRVCVSSAAASADADGKVVETQSALDCDP
jgi:hypothetical protein